jgi:acetyl-CoA carboxylase carboxyl transferase subunit beta
VLKDFFSKRKKYATIPSESAKRDIPEGIMNKCANCRTIMFSKELDKSLKVCTACGFHMALTAAERINLMLDENSFMEWNEELVSVDPLDFPDYAVKLKKARESTDLSDAVVTGEGTMGGLPVVVGVMDTRFMMSSMGSVVGEKITRAVERAIDKQCPVILFTAGGGARMQEGVLSLMQMAKTSSALARLHEKGGLYIAVLTNPTTGGTAASFAMLGDYNLAEPGAQIGLAGRRVIEQTIRQKLPDDFQTSEFLEKHGQLDKVVHRKDLRDTLITILDIHSDRSSKEAE